MEQRNIRVNAALFAAVAQIRLTKASAPHLFLKGVHIRPHSSGDGAIIEVTNGVAVAWAYDKTGKTNGSYLCGDPEWNRKTDLAKLVSLAAHKKYATATIDFDDNAGILRHGDRFVAEIACPRTRAKFPDLSALISSMDKAPAGDGSSAHFDGSLISQFAKASRILGQDGNVVIKQQVGASSPIIVQIPDVPMFGAIMPLAIRPQERISVPAWLHNNTVG